MTSGMPPVGMVPNLVGGGGYEHEDCMTRDHENYNLTLSIPNGSRTYKELIADGERTGTKQLGVLALIRLEDYYRLKEQFDTLAKFVVDEQQKSEALQKNFKSMLDWFPE